MARDHAQSETTNPTNPTREQVLALLVRSPLTESEIARALRIGRARCHEHARVLYREHGVSSRLALVLKYHGVKTLSPAKAAGSKASAGKAVSGKAVSGKAVSGKAGAGKPARAR
jgi:hypothetical protein